MKSHPRVLLVKFDKPPGGPLNLSYSEPIGICYLASYLIENHVDCRVSHIISSNPYKALIGEISNFSPDIIGFSVRCFNYSVTAKAIGDLHQEFGHLKVVLGGEFITAQNALEIALSTKADMVIIGDGESRLLEYVKGANPATIPSSVSYDHKKKHIFNEKHPPCTDISQYPMMLRDGLPMGRYSSDGFPGKRYATMHTQRGCRYRCTFCHTATRYKAITSRSVGQILYEIDFLVEKYGVEAIAIWDEDFFADTDRVSKILTGLNERGNPIHWHTFMKLSDLENPRVVSLLPKLRSTGYVRAVIGIESFLPETLKSYNKKGRGTPEKLCRALSSNDIVLTASYIIGAPHETCDNIKHGLNRLLEMRDRHGIKMDLPYVSFITPFPGTSAYNQYKSDIINHDWSQYDCEHVVLKCKCSSKRMIAYREQFYEKF